MANTLIYLCLGGFSLLAVFGYFTHKGRQLDPYRLYCWLLVPAFVLVWVGFVLGTHQLPEHALVIHGYRLPYDQNQPRLYLGSDFRDDVQLHHWVKDRDQIEKSIVEIKPDGGGGALVAQTQIDSPNIVSINGKPIRAMKLTPGRVHRITFEALGHRTDPENSIELEIPSFRKLPFGQALAKPIFRFANQTFTSGFSHEIGWVFSPWLPAVALEDGQIRHLSWNNRIAHPRLTDQQGSLLRQAALARYGNEFWLLANDAQIRLDGKPFPNEVKIQGSAVLKLESRQIGANRIVAAYKLIPPIDGEKTVYLELITKKIHPLPDQETAARICLSRNPGSYSNAFDVLDNQFPTTGAVLSREGKRFLFRGRALEIGTTYSSGKTVFSLERNREIHPGVLVMLAFVFMASAFFMPRRLIRSIPLIGLAASAAMLLNAFRLVLAFRAWQGRPFNFNVFLDSLAAPYLCMLALVVMFSQYPILSLFKRTAIRFWNFAAPSWNKDMPVLRDEDSGKTVFFIVVYGLILYGFFSRWLGLDYAMSIVFFLGVSFALNAIGRMERTTISKSLESTFFQRYGPVLSLVLCIFLAMIAAPLLGGREIIPFLPGRFRPDIFIQIGLLLIVAYQAGLWERDRRARRTPVGSVLIVYAAIFLLPLAQGVLARDMGFFVVVFLPLLAILLISSWSLDQRLKALIVLSFAALLFAPVLFKVWTPDLDSVWAQRVAFWVDKPRLRSEHFFLYQAQVPIQWASAQGLFGGGFFHGDWYAALKSTAVNDNVASVFIQGELGGLGSILTLVVYGLLSASGMVFIQRNRDRAGGFRMWVIFGASLMFFWTACTMFLQNFGYIPLTGKNLPFLGLDSKNDVIRYGLLLGLMVRYMRQIGGRS